MENYLEDIISQLIEEAIELKQSANDEFERGRQFAYYEIISRMLNQAEAFDIMDKIPSKWHDFVPEKLL